MARATLIASLSRYHPRDVRSNSARSPWERLCKWLLIEWREKGLAFALVALPVAIWLWAEYDPGWAILLLCGGALALGALEERQRTGSFRRRSKLCTRTARVVYRLMWLGLFVGYTAAIFGDSVWPLAIAALGALAGTVLIQLVERNARLS